MATDNVEGSTGVDVGLGNVDTAPDTPCERLEVNTGTLLTDGGQAQSPIMVLDQDALGTESATGWLVSDVDEVTTVTGETLDAGAVGDTDLLHGLIKNDDGFTLWLDPHAFAV